MPRIKGILRGINVYRPVLMIDIDLRGQSQRLGAIVDSGADYTLVPGQVIEDVFSTPFTELEPVPTKGHGVGGKFSVRICYGSATWRDWRFCDWFLVAEPGALEETLLGREDFLRRFDVAFCWNHSPPFFDVEPLEKSRVEQRQIEDEEERN